MRCDRAMKKKRFLLVVECVELGSGTIECFNRSHFPNSTCLQTIRVSSIIYLFTSTKLPLRYRCRQDPVAPATAGRTGASVRRERLNPGPDDPSCAIPLCR